MAGKYVELDGAILSLLKQRHPDIVGVEDIYISLRDSVENMNVIDRRMQHLKKKGLVYNKRCYGWGLIEDSKK